MRNLGVIVSFNLDEKMYYELHTMYHLPGIVPDDKATVSKLLEAEADARLSVVMKTIIETVLSKAHPSPLQCSSQAIM